MSLRNARAPHSRRKSLPVIFLGILAIAAGLVSLVGNRVDGVPILGLRPGGDARLVAFDPMPQEGPMCELEPAGATATLSAALAEQREESTAPASGDARPSDAVREELSKRKPARLMRDPSSAFSGIAVDLKNNEVVLTDENNFAIMSYDRMENTPPRASMSEPKRMIQGMEAYLEFNCSVYVDPNSGEIYSVNNDTLNWLTVFDRNVKGNMPPTRKLRAPHTVFGIAVDEERQEMLLAEQDDHAVVVFKKGAKDEDSPVRVIQGSKTLMADPHGIAVDPKARLVYVTNWGTSSRRPDPGDPSVKFPRMGGVARTLWPVDRNLNVPGSGKFVPPSITVYPKDSNGNVAPLHMIQGPKTGLNWPTAVAVDSDHGEIFVANDTADTVTVYKADANGDVAPIRVIKGPSTMVKNPTGITYDAQHQELWVANFGSHAATVFKRDANGDAKPLRVIRSAPADQPAPMMGNPHTIAYDTKREEILVSN